MGNSSYCNMDIQKSMGYPLNYDNTKGYVENFMKLMFEIPTGPYKASPLLLKH
jgi:citrate synthase